MRERRAWIGILAMSVTASLGLYAAYSTRMVTAPVRPAITASGAPTEAPSNAPQSALPTALAGAPPAPAPEASALSAPPPGAIKLTTTSRELYEEMSAILDYYKHKPLRDRGPVYSVGDGIDASERDAKLPAETPFSRFRYEYEKHDTARLLSDLRWAEEELARLDDRARAANGALSPEESAAGTLLRRRHRAIASILEARGRAAEIHDRYKRTEVIYKDPNAPPSP